MQPNEQMIDLNTLVGKSFYNENGQISEIYMLISGTEKFPTCYFLVRKRGSQRITTIEATQDIVMSALLWKDPPSDDNT